jgi:hypothetical protein
MEAFRWVIFNRATFDYRRALLGPMVLVQLEFFASSLLESRSQPDQAVSSHDNGCWTVLNWRLRKGPDSAFGISAYCPLEVLVWNWLLNDGFMRFIKIGNSDYESVYYIIYKFTRIVYEYLCVFAFYSADPAQNQLCVTPAPQRLTCDRSA